MKTAENAVEQDRAASDYEDTLNRNSRDLDGLGESNDYVDHTSKAKPYLHGSCPQCASETMSSSTQAHWGKKPDNRQLANKQTNTLCIHRRRNLSDHTTLQVKGQAANQGARH